jgi:hypothetical protein
MNKFLYYLWALLFVSHICFGQQINQQDKFAQLGTLLPTPNTYRTASGAPGPDYWQQKADYIIDVTINEDIHRLDGTEIVTYHNLSPDPLNYLWLQLDQNVRSHNSDRSLTQTSSLSSREVISTDFIAQINQSKDRGFNIEHVMDKNGDDLSYTINKTMMRIDLPEPLLPGKSFDFTITYWYNINNRMKEGGRSGYELFEEENNAIYTIAQFFPRMCVYNDVEGWQNKQFLGRGEFTLTFGDYEVSITVPSDHLVAATGTLQNKKEVLSREYIDLVKKAETTTTEPVIIASQQEAVDREKGRSTDMKTWVFKAENVRDFAFASSRKFIWDAMAVPMSYGRNVMAMSMYPKEANPLWGQYSTRAIAHTLKWFSHYTFDYPYPVAWSINAASIGMEYPMICFNYGRCEPDGTYSQRTKYGVISVIIHEVGHNYFPMIVNSDERQWTWMDEGLCSFVQYLAEQQWERNYPSRRGPAYKITDYMGGDQAYISPIMTNSESIYQFGNNAYGKPATALNILRETVMGRELFDKAFKEYAQRWKFKHPSPADFFRTMEDASGVDLDWFWRGWFYTTECVDQSVAAVRWIKPNDKNPALKAEEIAQIKEKENAYISNIRNKEEIKATYDEKDPAVRDFYSNYKPDEVLPGEITEYEEFISQLSPEEKEALDRNYNLYELTIENKGGLVMPVILRFNYKDGSNEVVRIPAEIWRRNSDKITKVFPLEKEVSSIDLDPFLEIADVNMEDNSFPPKMSYDRFEVFKRRQQRRSSENEMQRYQRLKQESP